MAENKITTRLLNYFGLERKARKPDPPDLGQTNYSPNTPRYRSYWGRRPERIDHKSEVGDLDLNSLAMAVVNFTTIRIPEARPCVVKKNANDDEERDFNHPMAQLIRRPNKHNIWANYAAACSASWWLNGNVYFYKTRSLTGVEELWYLPHFRVRPRWPSDGGSPDVVRWAQQNGEGAKDLDPIVSHYEYTPLGKAPVLYPAKDVIHIKRGIDLNNPRLGCGPFEALYKELFGDDKMALFTAAIFSNLGIQVPVFSPKDANDTIQPGEAAAMVETWMQKTTGSRAGEPVVAPVAVDIEKFGFSPDELDVSNLRLIIEARVCAVCQISPAALNLMVGVQNGTSYASSEQARQQGYEEVVIPIQTVWGESFKWQLLVDYEDGKDADFQFDTSKVRVLEEDRNDLFTREVNVFRGGGTTYDEFLTAIGKKPVGGEVGKIRLIPSTCQPTNEEQLIAKSDGSLKPEPADPNAATQSMLEEVEKTLAYLEAQNKTWMKGRT